MKLHRLTSKLAIVTGNKAELDKVECMITDGLLTLKRSDIFRLTDGSSHVHQNPPKGIKRPRKAKYPVNEDGSITTPMSEAAAHIHIAADNPNAGKVEAYTGDEPEEPFNADVVEKEMAGMEDKPVTFYGESPATTALKEIAKVKEIAPLPPELIERDRLIIEGMKEEASHER